MSICPLCEMPVPQSADDDLQCHSCDKPLPCVKWKDDFHQDSVEPFFCDTCGKAHCEQCIIVVDDAAAGGGDEEYICPKCHDE